MAQSILGLHSPWTSMLAVGLCRVALLVGGSCAPVVILWLLAGCARWFLSVCLLLKSLLLLYAVGHPTARVGHGAGCS